MLLNHVFKPRFECTADGNPSPKCQWERREVRGEGIRLSVSWAPQVIGLDGGDVRVEAELCGDPAPSDTRWTWGKAVMREGEERDSGQRLTWCGKLRPINGCAVGV